MKIKVFTDRFGRILATFRPTIGGKGTPSGVRVDVEGGREHEIDVPDDLAKPESIHKLHLEHWVDLNGSTPKLIRMPGAGKKGQRE